jgi:hypothetical protein
MAYATAAQLLAALGKSSSPENDARAQACLDAAAEEIDHAVDRTTAIPAGDPLAERVNLLRGVEWWKSNDAAFGVIGFDQTGALQAPRDGFARHGRTLVPLRQKFGVA